MLSGEILFIIDDWNDFHLLLYYLELPYYFDITSQLLQIPPSRYLTWIYVNYLTLTLPQPKLHYLTCIHYLTLLLTRLLTQLPNSEITSTAWLWYHLSYYLALWYYVNLTTELWYFLSFLAMIWPQLPCFDITLTFILYLNYTLLVCNLPLLLPQLPNSDITSTASLWYYLNYRSTTRTSLPQLPHYDITSTTLYYIHITSAALLLLYNPNYLTCIFTSTTLLWYCLNYLTLIDKLTKPQLPYLYINLTLLPTELWYYLSYNPLCILPQLPYFDITSAIPYFYITSTTLRVYYLPLLYYLNYRTLISPQLRCLTLILPKLYLAASILPRYDITSPTLLYSCTYITSAAACLTFI